MKRKGAYKRKCKDPSVRLHGNGYVVFTDERKLNHDGWDDQIEPEIRKPTTAEREEIVLNFIKANSGKAVGVKPLAQKLGVTDRVIQKILQKLEACGQIKRVPNFAGHNGQLANIIEHTGADKTVSPCNLDNLYDPDNPYGFRDWDWEEFKIRLGMYNEDFTKQNAAEQHKNLQARKKALQAKRKKLLEKNK